MGVRLLYSRMTNQPTNQPTDLESDQQYLSVRVTIAHNRLHELLEGVLHDTEYLIYKHGSASTAVAEHFHICIPGSGAEKFRKRLKDRVGGGNKVYSLKQFTNHYRSFVFYCEHEGSVPVFSTKEAGIDWQRIIDSVKTEGVYKKRKLDEYLEPSKDVRIKDRAWQLTYSNLVLQAVHWRNRNLKGCTSLKQVVKHMMEHSKWRPSKDMYKSGVPDVYQNDFEYLIGERTEQDMDWWQPKTFT